MVQKSKNERGRKGRKKEKEDPKAIFCPVRTFRDIAAIMSKAGDQKLGSWDMKDCRTKGPWRYLQ